jgi:hypothetical protein
MMPSDWKKRFADRWKGVWPPWVKKMGIATLRGFAPTTKESDWISIFDWIKGSLAGVTVSLPPGTQGKFAGVAFAFAKVIEEDPTLTEMFGDESGDPMTFVNVLVTEALVLPRCEAESFFREFDHTLSATSGENNPLFSLSGATMLYVRLLILWPYVETFTSAKQLHRFLCNQYGKHVIGGLKRIEKICQRFGMKFARRGRPKKKIPPA